jgi:two-component system alkaline phosphatase synthesis response regulator PhoP
MESTSPRKKRVLIVDDDRVIRMIEKRMLEAGGFEVVAAEDAESALEIARGSAFELFLFDVTLPGMSGFELARILSQEPATRTVPIIFATGLDERENAHEGFRSGASFYLTKPFSATTLMTMVRAALDGVAGPANPGPAVA